MTIQKSSFIENLGSVIKHRGKGWSQMKKWVQTFCTPVKYAKNFGATVWGKQISLITKSFKLNARYRLE